MRSSYKVLGEGSAVWKGNKKLKIKKKSETPCWPYLKLGLFGCKPPMSTSLAFKQVEQGILTSSIYKANRSWRSTEKPRFDTVRFDVFKQQLIAVMKLEPWQTKWRDPDEIQVFQKLSDNSQGASAKLSATKWNYSKAQGLSVQWMTGSAPPNVTVTSSSWKMRKG